MLASQCGHVFHGSCATRTPKCKACLAPIKDLHQVYYEEEPYQPAARPSEASAHEKPDDRTDEKTSQEVAEPLQGQNVGWLLRNLSGKLDQISDGIAQLRREVARRRPN